MTNQAHERDIPALTLGWRIKMALAHGNVSRDRIAEQLGVNKATVTRWSSDAGVPKRAFLAQIALATGVDMEWLETGRDDGPDGGDDMPDTTWYRAPSPRLTLLTPAIREDRDQACAAA